MYYHKCKNCGAYLDPGETCDCETEQEQQIKKVQQLLSIDKYGQITINFNAHPAVGH